MRRQGSGLLLVLGAGIFTLIPGCPGLIPPQVVNIDLNGGAGLEFQLTACGPLEQVIQLSFDPSEFNITGGQLQINPNALEIEILEGGANQVGGELTVMLRAAPPDQADTACESTDSYGPYTIKFRNDFSIESIEPSSIQFSQATLELLRAGSLSVCIEVDSPTCPDLTEPISLRVTIKNLTFIVNIAL